VIVQYPIEEEKGSVGSSSLHVKHYHSVFCQLFHRAYYNNEFIFVWPVISTEHLESEVPSFRCYYPVRDGFA